MQHLCKTQMQLWCNNFQQLKELEQLECLPSEDTPSPCPMITHTIDQFILDPKSKQDKFTNFKNLPKLQIFYFWKNKKKQGKSEGFESCDRPIVRKRPIWVKIGDVLSRVTLKFDGWPWKTIGHLFYATSSFVHHFVAIGDFKLELQSGNAQFGSNSTIFRAAWPWNLTDDLQKQ